MPQESDPRSDILDLHKGQAETKVRVEQLSREVELLTETIRGGHGARGLITEFSVLQGDVRRVEEAIRQVHTALEKQSTLMEESQKKHHVEDTKGKWTLWGTVAGGFLTLIGTILYLVFGRGLKP